MKIIEIRLYILNHTVCCTQPQKFPQSCCAAALERTCRRRLSSWHRTRHRAAGGSYDPWGPAGDSSFCRMFRKDQASWAAGGFKYVLLCCFSYRVLSMSSPKAQEWHDTLGSETISICVYMTARRLPTVLNHTWSRQSTRPRRKWGRRSRKVMEVGHQRLIQAEFRNQLRRLRGIGFSWCSWGFDVSSIMNWIIINQFIIADNRDDSECILSLAPPRPSHRARRSRRLSRRWSTWLSRGSCSCRKDQGRRQRNHELWGRSGSFCRAYVLGFKSQQSYWFSCGHQIFHPILTPESDLHVQSFYTSSQFFAYHLTISEMA